MIQWHDKVIAIDPGASFYLPDLFKTLIPKEKWSQVTHVLVTHGDPDHHWHTDRVAEASGAKVICNSTMIRKVEGQSRMLGPRSKGLTFNTPVHHLIPLAVDETLEVDGMQITGIKGSHGPLTLKVGPFSKTLHEGPNERFGFGEMGFQTSYQDQVIVNLGDTMLHEQEWSTLKEPDVLMIPIGGKVVGNTMDEEEALKAVALIKPKMVIPVHYDCGSLFNKCYNPANELLFKFKVQELGVDCTLLKPGESLVLDQKSVASS